MLALQSDSVADGSVAISALTLHNMGLRLSAMPQKLLELAVRPAPIISSEIATINELSLSRIRGQVYPDENVEKESFQHFFSRPRPMKIGEILCVPLVPGDTLRPATHLFVDIASSFYRVADAVLSSTTNASANCETHSTSIFGNDDNTDVIVLEKEKMLMTSPNSTRVFIKGSVRSRLPAVSNTVAAKLQCVIDIATSCCGAGSIDSTAMMAGSMALALVYEKEEVKKKDVGVRAQLENLYKEKCARSLLAALGPAIELQGAISDGALFNIITSPTIVETPVITNGEVQIGIRSWSILYAPFPMASSPSSSCGCCSTRAC
jgi:hypothetical protein